MIKSQIVDPSTRFGSKVSGHGNLHVAVGQIPREQSSTFFFSQFLTDNGTSTGSNDLLVDGSSSTQSFWVGSDSTADIHITKISFQIVDAGATLSKFGNITALTNGCKLFYFDQAKGEIILDDALKSNYDVVRLCGGNPSFGDSSGAFRASNVVSTSEGYIPELDLNKVIPIYPHGIKIEPKTNQKIQIDIRDNVTGLDAFNIKVYGFKRFPINETDINV